MGISFYHHVNHLQSINQFIFHNETALHNTYRKKQQRKAAREATRLSELAAYT